MVDTHTHIYLPEFDADREAVVGRAREAGLTRLVLPNVDLTTVQPLTETVAQYPGFCLPAMGLHPTSVDDGYRQTLDAVFRLLDEGAYCAVGEIGLDLYWDKTYAAEQIDALKQQMIRASEKNLPVIIHCREAMPEMLQVLEELKPLPMRGVFHSFAGTVDDVAVIAAAGDFCFGINGVVTFKNVHIDDVVREIGLHRLLLETDAPYLSPVPFRGKRNEPAYITATAKYLADVLQVSLPELDEHTTRNAARLFGWTD
ncbi:MAG: TatD family hydrolase [Coprobacter sp.]|nr:TatD family hydrolase [Coprobacter sp.]